MIDYFICSPELVLPKHHVMILNDGDNLSDHLAIIRKFGYAEATTHNYSIPKSKADYGYKLQWEKADIMSYQSYLNSQLNNVILPVDALLCNDAHCHKHCTDWECYYNNSVSCLTVATEHCIPSVNKHWWTPDLDDLKQNFFTNLWNLVGRPRSGSINAEHLRCKYRYKQAIKDAAYESDKCLNDDLFDYMCMKDTDSFWKSWRKRFCSDNIKPTSVLNGKTGDEILLEFTSYYGNVFKPNTDNGDDKFRAELDGLLTQHMHSTAHSVPRIDIVDLSVLIGRLKRREAAGIDGLVDEHIICGGVQLAVHLCLLFNALLMHSFVSE